MEEKRTKGTTPVEEAGAEFTMAVDELTEAIVEDLKEDYQSELEPFEAYAQRVRAEIHSNMEEFQHRFLRGYEVLLQELSGHYSEVDEQEEEKPPPGSIVL